VSIALALCDKKGRFLFEALTDLFPQRLTSVECELWGMYYEDKSRDSK